MKLPTFITSTKDRLLQIRDVDEADYIDISKYLQLYGLELDDFAVKIRNFYRLSRRHFYRCAYRNAIAPCLSLDMGKEADRDVLYERMGAALNPHAWLFFGSDTIKYSELWR
jgi:hypothetical protein